MKTYFVVHRDMLPVSCKMLEKDSQYYCKCEMCLKRCTSLVCGGISDSDKKVSMDTIGLCTDCARLIADFVNSNSLR